MITVFSVELVCVLFIIHSIEAFGPVEKLCLCDGEHCLMYPCPRDCEVYDYAFESNFYSEQLVTSNSRTDFRFHVLILLPSNGRPLSCSGVMLNDRIVITSKSCFYQSNHSYDAESKRFSVTGVTVWIQNHENESNWQNAEGHLVQSHYALGDGDLMMLHLRDYKVSSPKVFVCIARHHIPYSRDNRDNFFISTAVGSPRTRNTVSPSVCDTVSSERDGSVPLQCLLNDTSDIDHGIPVTYYSHKNHRHLLIDVLSNLNKNTFHSTPIHLHSEWIHRKFQYPLDE